MIRKAVPEDTKEIVAIWLSASRKAHDFIPYSYWLDRAEAMETEYIPASDSYVREVNGRIVGFLSLVENHVAALFVSPECQARGYGKQLLSFAKALRPALSLYVYKDNQSAADFYRQCGFDVTSERIDKDTSKVELKMEWKEGMG